ncbi:MAG TPA: DUF192 domain-containing protein [Acidimicrobiia bacterium]|nr:DUF192 domain-containing protein [Acidimicrobiia bacterium]
MSAVVVWLLRNGDVLASAEIASGPSARRKGLLGRDTVEGAFVLRPCRQVHTLGMRVPLDVAFCDVRGQVLRTCSLAPWRVSRPVWRSAFVVEAAAGSFERWHLRPGDRIEVRG